VVALLPALLDTAREHDDGPAVRLPAHPPEVVSRRVQRALSHDELPIQKFIRQNINDLIKLNYSLCSRNKLLSTSSSIPYCEFFPYSESRLFVHVKIGQQRKVYYCESLYYSRVSYCEFRLYFKNYLGELCPGTKLALMKSLPSSSSVGCSFTRE